ncbi:GNAT family N-acetyltransferase [Bacillus mangrovi]|uniref:GNAT family N-acetyltransferase n=1 Tax=Metabacillus mangrovi TaxID=1491830 RepID=A0A7X2V3C4_9BACI|nr:GNAT family N-acetyltransferase [Metabacillus mangrovi]MTH51868.1 GNAT family N-acetyltransferase [Metabacillus mangrovi]
MITIQKAVMADAVQLTAIMKRTFDEEARRWLENKETADYNIQPPGYDSVEMMKYSIEELQCYKIMNHGELAGGLIMTVTGSQFGRIDRIFVDPLYQGMKIGTRAMELAEIEYSSVLTWDLETSVRQVPNHHFYEKLGYREVFRSEDEICYSKRMEEPSRTFHFNGDIEEPSASLYDQRSMEGSGFYQVNLAKSSVSNSTLQEAQFSNCNLSGSKFQNINFRDSLFADLNLSNSKLRHVTLEGIKVMDSTLGERNHPVTFERCDLEGTKISGCSLKNAQITKSEIEGMTIDGISVEKLLEVYDAYQKKRDH